MIHDIMKKAGILKEATDIKKDSFQYFFIDEIKDVDTIIDIEDLGDRKNVEVLLTTDKNYTTGEPSDGTWFKIDSEDLIKHIEKSVDKFESGDYLDFMGGYGLANVIVGYLESTYQMKHYKDWAAFKGTMEGTGKVAGLKESNVRADIIVYKVTGYMNFSFVKPQNDRARQKLKAAGDDGDQQYKVDHWDAALQDGTWNGLSVALGKRGDRTAVAENYSIELVWNREFNWVKYGKPHESLQDAKKFGNDMLDSGDGARVKKFRVIDNNTDKVVYTYG